MTENYKAKADYIFRRTFEIFPGVLSWLAILSPFILSIRIPTAIAYCLLFMDMYWLYRSLRISAGVVVGYGRLKKAEAVDWLKLLREQFPTELESLYHLIVIPTLKEEAFIIEPTIKALAESAYPKDKIMVLLGFEARDDQERVARVKKGLFEKYGQTFGKLMFTDHPLTAGEVPGPAGNRTYAIKEFLQTNSIDPKSILLTTLDSDFCVHPQFLAGASYRYLTIPEAERDKRSYTGVFLYNNNYWETNAAMRVNAISTAFWQLSEMVTSSKYMNFASMTMNLKSVVDVGFWPLNVVNDDSAFYWRAYYHFNGDYKVIPHYLPLSADAVQDKTALSTYKNQYKQYQRWAYGIEHLPFVVRNSITKKAIPIMRRLDHLYFLILSNLSWAMLGFVVTFGGILLPLINPFFKQTVIGYNFPHLSSLILTIALIGLFTSVWVEMKITPPRPADWPWWKKALSPLQWLLTPFLIIIFGTIPALDAQTRLMLGRYLSFRVTIKERKQHAILAKI